MAGIVPSRAIAEHILATARDEIHDVVERIMERERPQLWRDPPPRVRAAVHARVEEQLQENPLGIRMIFEPVWRAASGLHRPGPLLKRQPEVAEVYADVANDVVTWRCAPRSVAATTTQSTTRSRSSARPRRGGLPPIRH